MNCPECANLTEVKDSRPVEGSIRRRRRCSACGLRFTTFEVTFPDSVLRMVGDEEQALTGPLQYRRARLLLGLIAGLPTADARLLIALARRIAGDDSRASIYLHGDAA